MFDLGARYSKANKLSGERSQYYSWLLKYGSKFLDFYYLILWCSLTISHTNCSVSTFIWLPGPFNLLIFPSLQPIGPLHMALLLCKIYFVIVHQMNYNLFEDLHHCREHYVGILVILNMYLTLSEWCEACLTDDMSQLTSFLVAANRWTQW